MTGTFGNRSAVLFGGPDLHKPNHILPLRMQGSGRNQADLHLMHVRRQLWAKALTDPGIWRRACRAGFAAGVAQVTCDMATTPTPHPAALVRMLITPALTLAASVFSAAGTYVQANLVKMTYWGN